MPRSVTWFACCQSLSIAVLQTSINFLSTTSTPLVCNIVWVAHVLPLLLRCWRWTFIIEPRPVLYAIVKAQTSTPSDTRPSHQFNHRVPAKDHRSRQKCSRTPATITGMCSLSFYEYNRLNVQLSVRNALHHSKIRNKRLTFSSTRWRSENNATLQNKRHTPVCSRHLLKRK